MSYSISEIAKMLNVSAYTIRYYDKEGNEFYAIDMVYQSVEQLRNAPVLDLDHPPKIVPLKFKGVEVDEKALCRKDAFLEKLNNSITKYDDLRHQYGL